MQLDCEGKLDCTAMQNGILRRESRRMKGEGCVGYEYIHTYAYDSSSGKKKGHVSCRTPVARIYHTRYFIHRMKDERRISDIVHRGGENVGFLYY